MASEVVLSNLSDDSEIKRYINNELMPRVFHDVPLNALNTGFFSIVNEYMSQALEQMSFTSSFYYNESFITKAMLPESIYAFAALYNVGYSFANPSSCSFLLELKIEDLLNNATQVSNNIYQFVLDKNTKFNLSNGSIYSLDYDIMIEFEKNIKPGSNAIAWNVRYTDMDTENVCSTNKNKYIIYRVTETWLCLYVQCNEYERTTYTVINNMMNNIQNPDKVINCVDHIAGFDVTYINGKGERYQIPHDHLLPIHGYVNDDMPYVHYIMDDPHNIRFKFQLNGNRYFVPDVNSSYEITIYSCHGKSANFDTPGSYDEMEQPKVITASNKYSNNANVLKAGFVISGSLGGTDIGTSETVRREAIEAANTVNVISSDHDIYEWLKTFYFKQILYPFFFKRRDDPSGKVWSGFLALKDTDNYVFKTNTLHCRIPYQVLYNNNDNLVSNNEIIIPPGWIWVYDKYNKDGKGRYTVIPYTDGDGMTVETSKTLSNINEKFVFTNPFGIRIQKYPFAIGYFNPWINETFTATSINKLNDDMIEDSSRIYHATPIITGIKRTYKENYYRITTYISPTIDSWLLGDGNGVEMVKNLRKNSIAPIFSTNMWNYFNEPIDVYAASIPILPLLSGKGFIPFNPDKTFLCVKNKNKMDDGTWTLSNIWIQDNSETVSKDVFIPITGEITRLYGDDETWGESGLWNGYENYVDNDTDIGITPMISENKHIQFGRVEGQNYYRMEMDSTAVTGNIIKVVVSEAIVSPLTKYGETKLIKIGKTYAAKTAINIYFADSTVVHYEITNAANIYMPYEFSVNENGEYEFEMDNVGANGVILYADMKPTPDSGAIEYYRIPFSKFMENKAAFYVENRLLNTAGNNMRVVLHTMSNGNETGYIEMQPISKESDGSYCFEAIMYPLNKLVDVDNCIRIASNEFGGGSWVSQKEGSVVSIDASDPELKMSIFIRSEHSDLDSPINIGDSFTGFRIVDEYKLDDVSLVQELKEMRSVVSWGESSTPTEDEISLYKDFISLIEYDENILGNLWNIRKYAYNKKNDIVNQLTFEELKFICNDVEEKELILNERFVTLFNTNVPEYLLNLYENVIKSIIDGERDDDMHWDSIYEIIDKYVDEIDGLFESCNINGGLEIQLVPMIENNLIKSERFESFVHSYTQVHKALEPVIFKRLEGNNYLDCKLIATYGLPHSYTPDIDNTIYWGSLSVQLEFDCHLFNNNLTTNTISELKSIIKSYFNRLTSIHTAEDINNLSMDNNIYISHIIQQMEEHDNVAYCRFKGWYTNEKNIADGNYMDANCQGIIQKHEKIEDFTTRELESYVPELYLLDDGDIVINIV